VTPSTPCPSRRRLLRVASALVAVAASVACGDGLGLQGVDTGGGGTGGGTPPVGGGGGLTAIGFLVASPGADRSLQFSVTLSVVVDTPTGPQWASGIANPRILVAGREVPLVTTGQGGVFEARPQPSPAVPFLPNETYAFRWSIVDGGGQPVDYELRVAAPAGPPTVDLPILPIRFANEPMELEVRGLASGGIWRITRLGRDPIERTWDPFAFSVAQSELARAELVRLRGPVEEVPGALLPAPGTYAIEFFNSSLQPATDPALGVRSWAVAMVPYVFDVTVE
jgi:hypothetical protein